MLRYTIPTHITRTRTRTSSRIIIIIIIIAGRTLKSPRTLSPRELGPFTVGLIDGDGSLQVNH